MPSLFPPFSNCLGWVSYWQATGTADSPVPHAAQEARLGGLLRKAGLACRGHGVGGVALLAHEAAVLGRGGLQGGRVSANGYGQGSVR